MTQDEAYAVDPITRKDLDLALEKQAGAIKDYLALTLRPIEDKVIAHDRSLYGEAGNNGLTGTTKGLTLKVKLLIVIVGVLFTTGITLIGTIVGAFIVSQFPSIIS